MFFHFILTDVRIFQVRKKILRDYVSRHVAVRLRDYKTITFQFPFNAAETLQDDMRPYWRKITVMRSLAGESAGAKRLCRKLRIDGPAADHLLHSEMYALAVLDINMLNGWTGGGATAA